MTEPKSQNVYRSYESMMRDWAEYLNEELAFFLTFHEGDIVQYTVYWCN